MVRRSERQKQGNRDEGRGGKSFNFNLSLLHSAVAPVSFYFSNNSVGQETPGFCLK